MEKTTRYLNLRGATGQIRTAKYNGTDHVVIPVIGLMEGVIWPVNAKAPEFVPAQVLELAPAGWNGRPVMLNHPDGGMGSANSPTVLEGACFGTLFNAECKDKQLHFEAWIDPVKAENVGAKTLVEDAQAGKEIEVSVGVLAAVTPSVGEYNGKKYYGVWELLIPDHLAFLSEGKGACSVEMGCGTRSAMHLVTAKGLEFEPMAEDEKKTRFASLKETWTKFTTLLGSGDGNLRRQLEVALEKDVPHFLGIDMVYPDDNLVVYSAMDEDTYNYRCYQAKFSADAKSGKPSVDIEKAVEVIKQQTFVKAEQKSACGCGNVAAPAEATSSPEGKNMNKNERIEKLLSSGRFKDTDKAWLTQVPEDRLESLEAAPVESKKEETPKVEEPKKEETPKAEPVAAAAKEQTEEEWLKTAPKGVRSMVERHQKMEKEHKDRLVAQLKSAQDAYTEAELQTKDVEELTKLASLAKIQAEPVDFSGRLPAREASKEDVFRNPPNGYRLALDARQKGSVN